MFIEYSAHLQLMSKSVEMVDKLHVTGRYCNNCTYGNLLARQQTVARTMHKLMCTLVFIKAKALW